MGDVLGAFRPDVASFPDRPGFLVPDEKRVAEFRAELDSLGDGLKVGILWKSLKMSASRARFFSPIDAWRPVLGVENIQFVNMQYGETEDDIAYAKDKFGIDIYTPKSLDLRDDLDGVAAMGKALDLMIGPMNASLNLSAAVGGEVWVFLSQRRHWTTFSSDRLPWYPTSRLFFGDGFADWDGIMKNIATALADRAGT